MTAPEIPAIHWMDDLSLGQDDYMIFVGKYVAGSGTSKPGHMLTLGKPADLAKLALQEFEWVK